MVWSSQLTRLTHFASIMLKCKKMQYLNIYVGIYENTE